MNSYGGKDSYLVTSGGDFERCLFSYRIFKTYDCVDCMNLLQGERCYECIDSEYLHTCTHLQNCKQCQRCDYCIDCSSCQDCLLCVGLRQKRYCIRNQQYTAEAYERMRAEILRLHSHADTELQTFAAPLPHPAIHTVACEQVTGDFLTHCKNVSQGYFTSNTEDVTEITDSDHTSLCFSINDGDYYTECIEVASAAWINHSAFCENSIHCTDCYYCSTCANCDYCFCCIGLKRKQYCILNKQYTQGEYEALVPRIIAYMRKTGEWGEFFPVPLSDHAYNHSLAQEYFPLTEEQARERGWRWQPDPERNATDPIPLPDDIADVSDALCTSVLTCAATGRPYKVVKQELAFYRSMGVPVPQFCFDERHAQRMRLRRPWKLWARECAKCARPIATSYAPERPEIVYCESCYLAAVY